MGKYDDDRGDEEDTIEGEADDMNMTSRRPEKPRVRRLFHALCALLLLCSSASILPGCEQQRITETESFEQAEVAYRQGRYRSALDDYERFLQHYPRSPLAKIAALRIKTINREVQSMLGRTATPPPLYIGEGQDAIKKTTSLNK